MFSKKIKQLIIGFASITAGTLFAQTYVSTQADLQNISNKTGDIILQNDLTLDGSYVSAFRMSGNFDGQGYTITLSKPLAATNRSQSLFNKTGAGAEVAIRNLNVVYASGEMFTAAGGKDAAGLVGELEGSLTIDGCNVSINGTLTGENAAGLIGICKSGVTSTVDIKNSSVTINGTLSTTTNDCGGLVGVGPRGAVDETSMIHISNSSVTIPSGGVMDATADYGRFGGIAGAFVSRSAVTVDGFTMDVNGTLRQVAVYGGQKCALILQDGVAGTVTNSVLKIGPDVSIVLHASPNFTGYSTVGTTTGCWIVKDTTSLLPAFTADPADTSGILTVHTGSVEQTADKDTLPVIYAYDGTTSVATPANMSVTEVSAIPAELGLVESGGVLVYKRDSTDVDTGLVELAFSDEVAGINFTTLTTVNFLYHTPVVGIEIMQDGSLLQWTVESERDVKQYNVILGDEIIEVAATGAGTYSITLSSDTPAKIEIVDHSGYTQTFIPASGEKTEVVLEVEEGWNLLSLPFCQVLGTQVFVWDRKAGQYVTTDEVGANQGFWYSADKAVTLSFEGAVNKEQVRIEKGWNLVGPSENVETPDNLIIYSWERAYEQTNVLTMGNGYWIYAEEVVDTEL